MGILTGEATLLIFVSLFIRGQLLTLLHSEWPKLHRVLAILGAIGLKEIIWASRSKFFPLRIDPMSANEANRFHAS